MNKLIASLCFLALLLMSSLANATVITSDTVWSGMVSVDEDVLIAAGATLRISPGTVITVTPSESTKTDPEYISPLTEITVRGSLISDGNKGAPVTFVARGGKKATWAGILVDGGKARLTSTTVRDAETGVYAMRGTIEMDGALLTKNHYGLAVQGREAAVRISSSDISGNDYGAVLMHGAKIAGEGCVVKGNEKKDLFSPDVKEYPVSEREYRAPRKEVSKMVGDTALRGEVIWQGRVTVEGIVRVPEDARLIILPGTIVEFTKKDTNGDGIGENGILIQGTIIAKGTREHPIFFRSAEKHRRMGDWDSINIMNSDKVGNLIEYCQIEDGYRGLHFHFANVTVTNSVIRNNYRGVQFQESIVEIRDSDLYGNKSGLQARDSEILFRNNVVSGNDTGMNVFRNTLAMKDNIIMNNFLEGLRVREGVPVVEGNLMDGNRYGIMVVDSVYGKFSSNMISHNLESGLSLKGTDNIEISGNVIQSNGIDGIHIQGSGGIIRNNLISDNAERGVGVLTFYGEITANNILENGRYNLGIEGEKDVSAPMNWWGGADMKKTISDKDSDPSKGRAVWQPLREGPVRLVWPLREVTADAKWRGDIAVDNEVTVDPGVELAVFPGARVFFAKGKGLHVKGRITARGEKASRILFAAADGNKAAEWGEVLIDHAQGSIFAYTFFENATWALHSHFTDLRVEDCAFVNNGGGIRFTSGPIEVRDSYFTKNDIGIRAFRGVAQFTGNVITGNRIGIFVREKGGGLTLRKNNLFANGDYNIRMGDFNTEDVDAKDNWWGSDSPSGTIYDDRREEGIGRVVWDHPASRPFPLSVPQGIGVAK
ncbi:MAG: right-handed parallel beta-helix repeat-containing protein [Nitrospiraceae bacterium]|nr:right-handed parallel beta-helix repeat-containing protein [Nitrospiraceae bacterium]